MTEKEAREIVAKMEITDYTKYGPSGLPTGSAATEAKGYLEAREKARGLEEAIEEHKSRWGMQSGHDSVCELCIAIAKFRETI